MSEKTWPLTIKEALQQMHIRISDEDKADLGKMQKNVFLATMHHQLGRWLRNTMGLWSGNNDLREVAGSTSTHPRIWLMRYPTPMPSRES